MSDKFLELKKLVIDELAGQFDSAEKKELAKEFHMTEEQMEFLVKKLLDKWLSNVDFVVMVATMLGISMPRQTKERRANYIG